MKVLAKNRRAGYDYQLGEKLVAGLVLSGGEVKSVRAGHASLKGSYIMLRNGEAWLHGAHVTPYQVTKQTTDPTRTRKLLLHRRQLEQLERAKSDGFSPVPVALIADGPFIKLELSLGRGKKRYDKRQTIKEREAAREAQRHLKT